ncbi:MAG: hypothetical protein ACYDBJ_00660 [Aggregatilineales bacterium]
MSKTKASPVSPTILVITLEADGNASLLTRRAELAHLSQFTYRGLPDIIAAIQSGAAQLIELEAQPPAIKDIVAPPISTVVTEPAAETADAPDEEPTDAPNEAVSLAEVQAMPVPQPDSSLFTPQIPQAKLF